MNAHAIGRLSPCILFGEDDLVRQWRTAPTVLARPGQSEPSARGEFPFPPQTDVPAFGVIGASHSEVLRVLADQMLGKPGTYLSAERLVLA